MGKKIKTVHDKRAVHLTTEKTKPSQENHREKEGKKTIVCQKTEETAFHRQFGMFSSCQRFSRDYNNFLIFILLTFVRVRQ